MHYRLKTKHFPLEIRPAGQKQQNSNQFTHSSVLFKIWYSVWYQKWKHPKIRIKLRNDDDHDFVDDVNRSLWSKLCLINEAHLASRVTKPGNLKCKKSTLGLIAEHLTNLVLIILDKPENLRLQRLSPIFTWRTKKQFFSHVYNVLCCSIIGKTIIAARLTIDKMGLCRSTSCHLMLR